MRLVALSIWVATAALPLLAETTPAPPDWPDSSRASVYLGADQETQPRDTPGETARYAVGSQPAEPAAPIPPAPKIDFAVVPALHEAPTTSSEMPARRLAPPSNRSDTPSDHKAKAGSGAHRLLDFNVPFQSMYTVMTALAIVIGAFLLFAYALRRGARNTSGRRGMLPADAVSVLGRVPLAARQFAELLRVGNKLVLVALTPNGPQTLTEVTDPVEVDRLVGMCQQFDPHSTTKAFEQVFQQLSSEPGGSGFLGNDPMPTSLSSLSSAASAYRSQRGAGTRG